MRKVLFSLGALAAAATLSATATARADDKSDIKAAYAKIAKAMKAKDVKGVMAMGTPDFSEKEANGQVMDAKHSEAMMAEQFKMTKSMDEVAMTPKSFDIKGKTAVVASVYTFKGTILTPDGKSHKMVSNGTSKDTLVKTPHGWLFKKVEMGKDNTLMDGKKFDPTMMAPPKPGKKK
jgi:ketosteroid isomerase-like protein